MPNTNCSRRYVRAGRAAALRLRSAHATHSRPAEPLERRVLMAVDFGDAPAVYGTTLSGNGARHTIVAGLRMGQRLDGENDGQPTAAADGDDLNPAGGQGDDEDGVSFSAAFLGRNTVTQVNIQASAVAAADAFIDFNRDGDFADPGEKVIDNQIVNAGGNVFDIRTPANIATGPSYARFRVSSQGGLGPAGPADDGEVEDYAVTLADLDWGDAPDSYGTTSSNNGAASVIGNLFMGNTVDSEVDGQPTAGANGDDANPPAGPDDEDGANVSTFRQGRIATFTGTISATGHMAAWVDFNNDGVFDEFQEVVHFPRTGPLAPLSAGTHTATRYIPSFLPAGNAYVRFRVAAGTSNSLLAPPPVGFFPAPGEVEDYVVQVLPGVDWGDAPDTYGTTLAANGPRHGLGGRLFMGSGDVDSEDDGQPSPLADADDQIGTATSALDDDDGVTFVALGRGGRARVTVNVATTGGRLDAFFDFNRDGDFADAGEKVFDNRQLSTTSTTNFLEFQMPQSAQTGITFARFRISSAGGLGPAGPAADGEVEDYRVAITEGLDFGDLPSNYPSTLFDNGPRHRRVGVFLGAAVDTEPDTFPHSFLANSDDNDGVDDEDGVTLPDLTRGQTATFIVRASAAGRLDGFVDLNGDDDFTDPGEKVFNSVQLAAGFNTLTYDVPANITLTSTYARFRVSDAGGLSSVGEAPTGEVEDYLVITRSAPPVVTLPGPTVFYPAGAAPVVVDPTATLSDPDAASTGLNISKLIVDFASASDPQDRLAIRAQGDGPGEVNLQDFSVKVGGVFVGSFRGGFGSPLVVEFFESATLERIQAVMRNVIYNNFAAEPTSAPRIVRFVFDDARGGVSAPATQTIQFSSPGLPRVTAVYLSSTAWAPPAREFLQNNGQGSDSFGQAVPGGAAQLLSLPQANINRVSIQFSKDVSVQQSDLSVRGVNVANYGFAPNGFTYDPATLTATWTLNANVGRDKLLLDLDADAANGVTDGAGNRLDGEWNNAGDNFPSGNAAQGGDFRFRVNVVPGDANGSRTVDVTDLGILSSNFNRSPRLPREGDFNGDLVVDVSDLGILSTHFNRSLPSGEPAVVAAAAVQKRPASLFSATPIRAARPLLRDLESLMS
jgi:hypothetical protein